MTLGSRLSEVVLRRLIGSYGRVSYSQEGEDLVVARQVGDQPSGFYVDVGAHHPVRFSNTYLFYRRGWSGVVIDPSPESARQFRRVRPRDVPVTVAIGSHRGAASYFQFDEPALNTLSRNRLDELTKTTSYRLVRTSRVAVEPLSVILNRVVNPGTRIDLMSVDTEGLDREVLDTNDWAAFLPRFVIVEDLSEQVDGDASETSGILKTHGYRLIAWTGNSRVWRASESTHGTTRAAGEPC